MFYGKGFISQVLYIAMVLKTCGKNIFHFHGVHS